MLLLLFATKMGVNSPDITCAAWRESGAFGRHLSVCGYLRIIAVSPYSVIVCALASRYFSAKNDEDYC